MRDLSVDFIAALEGGILYPLFFYELAGSSGIARLWTGFGDRTWDGHTWNGVGWVIGMSAVEESTDTRATSLTLGLPAKAEIISTALQELKRKKPGNVWLGLLDGAGALVDVQQVFAGGFDLAELDMDVDQPAVRLRYASKIADLERSRVRRQTPADQAIDYPGDRFFDYVGPLTDKLINWGGTG